MKNNLQYAMLNWHSFWVQKEVLEKQSLLLRVTLKMLKNKLNGALHVFIQTCLVNNEIRDVFF